MESKEFKSIETTRFGTVTYSAKDEVNFEDGLLGFPACKNYVILQHKENSPFRWLQSVDNTDLAFLVVDPSYYLLDYCPTINPIDAKKLDIVDATKSILYVIVNIPKGKPKEMTVNLLGPIIVNTETGRARQCVVEDEKYTVKHRVFQEETERVEEAVASK